MKRDARLAAVSLLSLALVTSIASRAEAACPDLGSDANSNTCVGDLALGSGNLDTGAYNSAFGSIALYDNTTGSYNTGIGNGALSSNTTGNDNTALGSGAMQLSLTGGRNTAIGHDAISRNTTGSYNTATGMNALFYNETSSFNTAVGYEALHYATGEDNIALGYQAGRELTTGSSNIAIGHLGVAGESETIRIGTPGTQTRAFVAGIRDVSLTGGQAVVVNSNGQLGVAPAIPGANNVALGASALGGNVSGNNNTATGTNALAGNTSGSNNTAVGNNAGVNLTTGSNNIAINNAGIAGESATIRIGTQGTQTRAFVAGIRGVSLSGGQAVVVNSSGQLGVAPAIPGTSNVALGGSALVANTTGNYNTAAGASALSFNTSGANNTATGASALNANTTGSNNTASGVNALRANTIGAGNSASGVSALRANTQGSFNTAAGMSALQANTTGSQNVAIGYEAAKLQTTGIGNIALGYRAGQNWTIGSNNIAIANSGVAGEQKTIRIGVQGTQTRAFVAGVRGVNVTGGQAVVVDANGQLGVVSSSRRYKQDIQSMGDASSALRQLRPVTFHYKEAAPDGSNPLQYGLVAEEVAQVMPQLAIYNAEGQPESVAYQVLPSLLLNEYQKQAAELESTKADLARLQSEMVAMKQMLAQLSSAAPGQSQFALAP